MNPYWIELSRIHNAVAGSQKSTGHSALLIHYSDKIFYRYHHHHQRNYIYIHNLLVQQ
jgi:hypothetical protein